MKRAPSVRFPVDPRDIPAEKAARRLHLTLAQFKHALPALYRRGFPRPDQTTGMFDLKAIDAWMDKRSELTPAGGARDAAELFRERLETL